MILKKIEKKVKESSEDYGLYRDLLKMYFFDYPELIGSKKAQDLVIHIIKEFPEKEGDWSEWSSHFHLSTESKSKVLKIWKRKTSGLKVAVNILNNAGTFCLLLDTTFAAKCFLRLHRKDKNNLDVLDNLSRALYWMGNKKRAFEKFNLRMSISKKIDPFVLSEAVMCAHETHNIKLAREWGSLLKRKIKQMPNFSNEVKDLFKIREIEGYI